jgi:K+-sensing histidine kinase KdpD
VATDRVLRFARPPAKSERRVQGDRELLRRAMLNLGMSALRRAPARSEVSMNVTETDAAVLFRVTVPGDSLQGADRLNAFEPYPQRSVGAAGYGLGLALARAIVELHEGHVWIEDVPEGGCAYVFELKWQRRGPVAVRPLDRAERV